MKPPDSAPALAKMAALKAKFEADREVIFPRWKAALEAAQGNVRQAASVFVEYEGKGVIGRDRGRYLTEKLGLVEYARALRGGRGKGRPRKQKGKSKNGTQDLPLKSQ